MCSWDRFCSYAREPERCTVDSNARIKVAGAEYEVDANLAGQEVVLWWGLFDNELFVEHDGQKAGPYSSVSGPVPLHKYRKFKNTKAEERADRIEALANQLGLPRAAITGEPELSKVVEKPRPPKPTVPFPASNLEAAEFPSPIAAKRAISQYFGPMGNLPEEDQSFIVAVLEKTLNKQEVLATVKAHFAHKRQKIIEVARQSGSVLTVVLIGHPKLKNDLERPTMCEIGHRTRTFTFDGVADSRREFIEWLLDRCTDDKTTPEDIFSPQAIELIAERSATALQIQENLNKILIVGHETAERPISTDLVESGFAATEQSAWLATITRHGYDVRSLSEYLNVKQSEVKQLFAGQFDPMRTSELNEQLRVVGLPGR